MQSSENSKTVAVVLLILSAAVAAGLLSALLSPCTDLSLCGGSQVNINLLLLSDQSIPERLQSDHQGNIEYRHTRANFRLDEVVHEIEEELKHGLDL